MGCAGGVVIRKPSRENDEVSLMAQINLTWVEQQRFIGVDSAGHSVVLSPPNDVGVKPSETLLIALAACAAHDVVEILQKQRARGCPGWICRASLTLRAVEDAVAIRQWVADAQPAHGVIVGGGYIGLELAEALAAHGIQVTIVEALGQILPTMDPEIVASVQAELAAQRVGVRLEQAVEGFAGAERVREVLAGGQRFPADADRRARGGAARRLDNRPARGS